jgi:AcrR family transcriptional regulator
MRADAQRNRDRLLEMAVDAFARRGPDVTLDAIAKAAGVGIGTLYRHFPTREALIEAAYRNELGRLCDAAPELLDALPPDRALREWMARFVGYMATKREMSDALVAVIASGGNPYAVSWDRLLKAVESLLGAMGSTVDPGDVLYSLSGITMVANEAPERVSAERLLDLLMKAL